MRLPEKNWTQMCSGSVKLHTQLIYLEVHPTIIYVGLTKSLPTLCTNTNQWSLNYYTHGCIFV